MIFIQSLVLIYNLIKNAAFIQKLRFNLQFIQNVFFIQSLVLIYNLIKNGVFIQKLNFNL
jgi:hypothetical protein